MNPLTRPQRPGNLVIELARPKACGGKGGLISWAGPRHICVQSSNRASEARPPSNQNRAGPRHEAREGRGGVIGWSMLVRPLVHRAGPRHICSTPGPSIQTYNKASGFSAICSRLAPDVVGYFLLHCWRMAMTCEISSSSIA